MLDPFSGTGSLLCTCAHFGCLTVGADIDPRVFRGKGIMHTGNLSLLELERSLFV
jgi:tRNA G10  N-methylase Trm11